MDAINETINNGQKSVGTILKETRLAKKITLDEIERSTNIRARYLQAVENDDYANTPGEVFLKGMIRTYGNYLGLDGVELVNQYKASAAGVAASAVRSEGIREAEKVKLNIQLKNPRDIGSGTGKMEMPALPYKKIAAGIVGLLILAGGYFGTSAAIDYFKSSPSEEPAVVATTEAEKTAAAPVKAEAIITDRVEVIMEAGGPCWLEVNMDGKEEFAGMMHKGDKKTFTAPERMTVKYGNIGVMKLTVNGKAVDLDGEHGVQVKTYTRENAGQ